MDPTMCVGYWEAEEGAGVTPGQHAHGGPSWIQPIRTHRLELTVFWWQTIFSARILKQHFLLFFPKKLKKAFLGESEKRHDGWEHLPLVDCGGRCCCGGGGVVAFATATHGCTRVRLSSLPRKWNCTFSKRDIETKEPGCFLCLPPSPPSPHHHHHHSHNGTSPTSSVVLVEARPA